LASCPSTLGDLDEEAQLDAALCRSLENKTTHTTQVGQHNTKGRSKEQTDSTEEVEDISNGMATNKRRRRKRDGMKSAAWQWRHRRGKIVFEASTK